MNCPRCGYEQFASPQSCPRCGFAQPSLTTQAELVMSGRSSEQHPLTTQPALSQPSSSLILKNRKVDAPGMPGMPLQGNHYLLVEQQEKQQWSLEIYEVWWLAQDMESREDVDICEVVLPLSGSTIQVFLRSTVKALLACSNSSRMSSLLNVFMEHGHCFFVFTHPTGESLYMRIQREGMLPEQEAIDCYLQGTRTLLFLSEQNPPMVHGSLQPDHLVKVGSNWVFTHRSILIAGGGTTFISPSTVLEEFKDIPTPASDLYALTAAIYYAVTGITPSSDARIQQAHLMNATLSSAFSTALLQGIHPDVRVQYQHPSEIVKALGVRFSRTPETARRASRSSGTLGNAQPEQKPERSTVPLQHASRSIEQQQTLPMMRQGQEGILLQAEHLSPFPQSPDILMAMVWTLGILLCTLVCLLVAR